MCVCTHVKVREQLCGVVLPFYVGVGGQTQVVRLMHKSHYPGNHVTGPISLFVKILLIE